MTSKSASSTRPRRVTMKDVADQCGVSLSTVSLVLSGDTRIPPVTTQRVLEVVKSLGYRPNALARNLARQRSKTFGLVLPEVSAVVDHAFVAEALHHVAQEVARLGYRLLLEIATPQFVNRRFHLRLLKENSVDGVIYFGAGLNDDFLRDVEPFRYPFVLLGDLLDGIQLSYAAPDTEMGARLATEHLLNLGHRRIAHLAGPGHLSSARDALLGYRRALEAGGAVFDPALVADGGFDAERAKAETLRLLGLGVTAITAANDVMAAGALRAVKESGRRVPQDVSITGLGDKDISRWLDPPLTTARADVAALAAEGVRGLLQIIERGDAAAVFQKRFPMSLVSRSTTAEAPQAA